MKELRMENGEWRMERLGAIDEEDNWNKILTIFVLLIEVHF